MFFFLPAAVLPPGGGGPLANRSAVGSDAGRRTNAADAGLGEDVPEGGPGGGGVPVDDDGGGGRARAEPDRVGGPVGGPLDPPEGGGGLGTEVSAPA
jgi:hypothetical protein